MKGELIVVLEVYQPHEVQLFNPISVVEDLGFEVGVLAGSVTLMTGARHPGPHRTHPEHVRGAGVPHQPGVQPTCDPLEMGGAR